MSVLVWGLAWLVTVAVANTGATAVAQPSLRETFGVGPGEVGWVVFGYTAAFAVSTAWYGRAAHRFGAARSISFGACVLGGGALVAATAPSYAVLLTARIAQGLGAGAIPTLAFAMASEPLEGVNRSRAIGLIVAGVGVGQASGPLLGGVLISTVSWRAALAVGLLVVPAVPVVLRQHRGATDRSASLDLLGGLQLAVVVGGLIWVLNRAPIRGLDHVVLGVTGLTVVVALWAVLHVRRHGDAFLPRHVLGRRGFASRALAGALLMAAFTAVLTGVPIVFADGDLASGVMLGLLMFPMALALALVSSHTRRLPLRHEGSGILVLGMTVLALAAAVVAMVSPTDTVGAVMAALVPVGVSYGVLAVPLTVQISDLFPVEDRAVAFGSYHVAFFVGGAVGGSVVAAAIDQALPAGQRGLALIMLAIATMALATAVGVAVRGFMASVGSDD